MSSQVSLENQSSQSQASLVTTNQKATSQLAVSSSVEKVIQVGWQMSALIEQIPQYWTEFWQAYKRPIVLLGWILGSIVTLKVFLAILGAINGLPLLAPLLELIGLVVSLWFTLRYLVGFANRQAILSKLNSLKAYIFGAS